MKRFLIITTIVLVSACSARMMITQTDADRGAVSFPGVTISSLQQGKVNYENNCQGCHALEAPKSETEAKWYKIVPVMVRKTNKKADRTVIDSAMEISILQYVVTMASAPPTAEKIK